jgi:hypothetical protein
VNKGEKGGGREPPSSVEKYICLDHPSRNQICTGYQNKSLTLPAARALRLINIDQPSSRLITHCSFGMRKV